MSAPGKCSPESGRWASLDIRCKGRSRNFPSALFSGCQDTARSVRPVPAESTALATGWMTLSATCPFGRSSGFLTAYTIKNNQTQRDPHRAGHHRRRTLGDQITMQVLQDWGCRPGRTLTVKVIENTRIHD